MIRPVPNKLGRHAGHIWGQEDTKNMDDTSGLAILWVILAVLAVSFVISIVIGIFYCLTLQKALSRCSSQNRTLSPGLVWLYLIPVFNLIWHFVIVINLAKSLHAEFVSRNMVEEQSPGYGIGLATCILNVVGVIPYVGWLTGIPGLICWIIYWVKIAGYSGKIALPYRPAEPPAGAASAA
jgi:ABC-type phosphate transport system permease subunit